MQELILAIAGLILELLVFFCAGSLLTRILKMKTEVTMELVLGYLLYFAVFEILAVPMTLKWVKLSTFSYLWMVIMAACVLAACLFSHKLWKGQLDRIGETFRKHSLLLLLIAAAVILQCFLVAAYQDVTADATHYIGAVSTSVYTDTLARYSPLTGVIQRNFNLRYDLSAYPMNNAVWCVLLGIHPIVQSKVVMSVINMLMINLLIYQIGKSFFRGDEKKADLMVLFQCVDVFRILPYLSCGSQYGDPSGDGAEEKAFLRDSLCALYAAGIFVCPGLFFGEAWMDRISGIIGNWEDTMDRRRKWRE